MKTKRFRWLLAAALFGLAVLFSSCEPVSPGEQDDNVTPPQSEAAVSKKDGSETPDTRQAEVLRVIDGDTIEVSLDGVKEKIRLIGIDTPESVHPDAERNVPYGKIAAAFTKDKLDGQTVGLEFDVQERDQYGRVLAYVWLGDVMFNKLLVDEGHASVSTYPPNVKYVDVFTASQKAARETGVGQWSYGAETKTESAAPDEPSAGTDKPNDEFDSTGGARYIGNSRSMKFHTLTCEYGLQISPNNAVDLYSRDEATGAGYAPCKVCKP